MAARTGPSLPQVPEVLTGVRSLKTHHPPIPPAMSVSRSRSLPPFSRFWMSIMIL